MTPERIAEIRAMPHDNWRIVHELLEALDAANAELSRLRSSPAREREIVELSKQVATIARERDEAQGVDAAYLNDASLRATRMKVRFGEAALLPLPQRIRCIALAVKEFATSGWERVAVADIAAEIGDCAHDVQRMSVPQGVEVPELTGEECEQILRSFPASLPAWEDGNWALAFAKVVEFVRARLVPTPPQATEGGEGC